jgi:hypothetical protein
MNIKSLLLGSAAALVAVSGARAADAVVIAEPEPMEYVRVCDTYGAGFYYIPGTETCLKVSGYLRYDIGAGAVAGLLDVQDKEGWLEDPFDDYDTNDTYFKRARFALRVDARSETELGTLRAYAQINFQSDTNTVNPPFTDPDDDGYNPWTYQSDEFVINHAYLELGGFRAGKTDSLFSTFTGYSSGVANDGIIPYGPFDTNQIAYTFTGGNGFSAAVALETGWQDYTIDDYVPHMVAGLGYTGGWGGVSAVIGYDSIAEEYAVKGRVDFNAMEGLTLFAMAGWDSGDEDDVFGGENWYAQWGGDWALWVGGAWAFNEKTTLNVEIGYDDSDDFSTVVGLDYELVENFHIIPEIIYVDNFDIDDTFQGNDIDSNWGGFLRLQANFGG